jgi:hypothetical protein
MVLPRIDNAIYQSAKTRPLYFFFYWILFFDFIILGWIGQQPVEYPYTLIGTLATAYYFFFFLILLPLLFEIEKFLSEWLEAPQRWGWQKTFLFKVDAVPIRFSNRIHFNSFYTFIY